MISPEEIKKIADLARLELSLSETSRASADISAILEHFQTISTINTDDVTADTSTEVQNVMREDKACANILASPQELLANTKTTNGYVEVPGVFANIALP